MADNDGWQDTDEDAATAALERDLLDTTSTHSFSIPAIGDTITILGVGSGKEMHPGTIWKWAYQKDVSKNFNLIVQAYDGTDVSGFVIKSNGAGEGPYDLWAGSYRCDSGLNTATVGLSSDEMAVPAINQTVSANILADKLVSRNVSVLFSDTDNFDNYFRIRVLSYDEDTGDVEGICTARNGAATVSAWIVTLIPGPPTGGGNPPTSVVKQAEATSTTATIDVPADCEAGDFLVLADYATGFVPTGTFPEGFTPIYDELGGLLVSVKLADGTEAGATLTGMDGTTERKILHVYRPNSPASTFLIVSKAREVTAANPAAQIITAASGAVPLVGIAVYASSGDVDPRSMTPAKDGETANGTNLYVAWKIYDTAPADITVDMDDEGTTNALLSFYVELKGDPPQPGDSVVLEEASDNSAAYPYAAGLEAHPPGGRLALDPGAPVEIMNATNTTIYYVPYVSRGVPIFDGVDWRMRDIGPAGLSQALSDATKSPAATVRNSLYNLYVWDDNGTIRLSRGPMQTKQTNTFTVTIASPAVVTITGHDLRPGDIWTPTTTGAVPTGMTVGTPVIVLPTGFTTNTFRISATVDGAAINTSGTQSGVHTATYGDNGNPSTELTRNNGCYQNASAITNGPAAERGTYVGTIRTNDSNAVEHGPTVSLWNYYNRVAVSLSSFTSTNSWTYTTATWRIMENMSARVVKFLVGLREDDVYAAFSTASGSDVSVLREVGIDICGSGSIAPSGFQGVADNSVRTSMRTEYNGLPEKNDSIGPGWLRLAPIERSAASGTTTWYGDISDPAGRQQGFYVRTKF